MFLFNGDVIYVCVCVCAWSAAGRAVSTEGLGSASVPRHFHTSRWSTCLRLQSKYTYHTRVISVVVIMVKGAVSRWATVWRSINGVGPAKLGVSTKLLYVEPG